MRFMYKEKEVYIDPFAFEFTPRMILLRAVATGELEIKATTVVECPLPRNTVAVKDYTENEGMLDWLIKNHIVEEPVGEVSAGFVKIPICEITRYVLNEME